MSAADKFKNLITDLPKLENYTATFETKFVSRRTVTANAEIVKDMESSGQYVRAAMARRTTAQAGVRNSTVSHTDEKARITRALIKPHLNNKVFDKVIKDSTLFLTQKLQFLISTSSDPIDICKPIQEGLYVSMIINFLGVELETEDWKKFNQLYSTQRPDTGDSFIKLLLLNLISWIPLFIKDLLSPGTRRTVKHWEEIAKLLYEKGKPLPGSLAEDLKRAEADGTITHKDALGEYHAILVGAHTLMVSLMWSLYLLSREKSATEKVIKDHKYARLAYLESMRLLPPFYMLSYDKKKSKCPFHFDKSETVHVSVVHLQRIPEYWGSDAEQFKPERFEIGLSNLVKGSYMPFGIGERSCPGTAMSMKVGPALLQYLIKNYEFKLFQEPVIKKRLYLITKDHQMLFNIAKRQGITQ